MSVERSTSRDCIEGDTKRHHLLKSREWTRIQTERVCHPTVRVRMNLNYQSRKECL